MSAWTPGGGDSVINAHVIGIESKDSCQLHQTDKQVSATGDCPEDKTCTLQERRKNSIQGWKNSAANPQAPESQMEYRPNCVL